MAILSKTKLKERLARKTNPETREIISLALKNKAWHALAHKLSGPTRNLVSVNLFDIEKNSKDGETLVIPGAILSLGTVLTKKVKLAPLKVSASARAKLKESKTEIVSILDEIKKNPSAKGVRILQ